MVLKFAKFLMFEKFFGRATLVAASVPFPRSPSALSLLHLRLDEGLGPLLHHAPHVLEDLGRESLHRALMSNACTFSMLKSAATTYSVTVFGVAVDPKHLPAVTWST